MIRQLRTAFLMFVSMTVLTGFLYPFAITAIAQIVFPGRANGSLIQENGKIYGSDLIGQPFDDLKYFWSRPSATAPYPYNAGSSTGSNNATSNPAQLDAVKARVEKLKEAGVPTDQPIPADLVTASGSGLDPHISVAASEIQIPRVAKARGMTVDNLRTLVRQHTEGRQLGILGEPRVNVLLLNRALDKSSSGLGAKDVGK